MCKFKKLIAAWTAALIFTCSLITPETASALTIKEEEELSAEFLEAVFEAFDIIEDPVIHNYLNDVGQKIISVMPPQPFAYKFYAVRQDAYNAFAGPAGNIFVFSGLFSAVESEDELAALLAHEIAHVSCRHISEMMKKSKKSNMASLAGVVAGILIGLGGAATVGSALTIGSMAAGQSMALAYSREHEMQADQIGRTYLQKAGYNLNGLLSILKKIRSVDWFTADEIPTYLKTHPATEERILYLDNLLENREVPLPEKNYAFTKAHARMTALYGDADAALRLFKGRIENNPNDAMAHYGYGLALSRNGNPNTAVDHLKIAAEKNPDDPDLKIDLGIACFMAGKYPEALEILEKTSKATANAKARQLYIGRSLMGLERYEQAADIFRTIIEDDPDNVEVYLHLGKAEGKLDRLGRAHFYLGQYYLKSKNRQTATFHFKKALTYKNEPEQTEEINQLLKSMEKPRRFFNSGNGPDQETDSAPNQEKNKTGNFTRKIGGQIIR